jgi:hypothetical protein
MGMGAEHGEDEAVMVMFPGKTPGGDGVEMMMMRQAGRSVQELAGAVGDMVADVATAVRSGGRVDKRTQEAMQVHAPRLKQAAQRVGADAVQWMHQGGLWRSALVMAVGLISVTTLTGLTAFLMAVLVATVNAVIIGFLMCLSAVGAFLAMFCTSLTFIYIGAVTAAALAIGSAVFMASCAVLFFTGWILFAWAVWEVMKKSLNLVRGTPDFSKKKVFVP